MEKPNNNIAIPKKIIIPVDGSKNALKSLDYLDVIYGSNHNIEVDLLYILPALPLVLTDTKTMDKRTISKLALVQKKNIEIGKKIVAEAKTVLTDKGFDKEKIKTFYNKKEISSPRDISDWANRKQADAVLIARRGRTDLGSLFMGGVSNRLVDYNPVCPIWIAGDGIHSNKALVCMDSSENALRAADHAGFMLSGTGCRVILFHTIRHLTRFMPREAIKEASDIEDLWKNKASKEIAPYMEKAKKMLLEAGLDEDNIDIKVANGSRSAADDIIKEAQENNYGTIVLGRRGISAAKEFFMGRVTSKVLRHYTGIAVWIVQ